MMGVYSRTDDKTSSCGDRSSIVEGSVSSKDAFLRYTHTVQYGTTWNFPLLNRILFPTNTVVDVQVGTDAHYEWIIEFQCIQGPPIFGWNWTGFYAFNFYSRTINANNDEQRLLLQIMEARARQRGIGPFIDHGAKLATINHSNFLYAQSQDRKSP
jgi:hypothetical protein